MTFDLFVWSKPVTVTQYLRYQIVVHKVPKLGYGCVWCFFFLTLYYLRDIIVSLLSAEIK